MRGGGDLLYALPDHVLQHVLSFIPTRESVQASLLSRRWRHIWRSTPALRVDGNAKGRDDAFAMFVNRFLLLRDGASPLSAFKMDIEVSNDDGDSRQGDAVFDEHVELWIRHAALTCRTLALTAFPAGNREMLRLTAQPLAASRNLTKLKLCRIRLADGFLDFSHCPALLELALRLCHFDCQAILSPSLERLSVTDCTLMSTTRISTPSLRSLHFSHCWAVAPSLESMPSLRTATIWLSGASMEHIHSHCHLLHGLAEATSLKLIAPYSAGQAIFQGDLKWCPTFSNLRTLILNEWCVYGDETALACLLRHSPMLQNLTFEVTSYGSNLLEAKPSYITSDQTTFEHLKIVEIKCRELVCASVFKILKLLTSCGLPLSKISILATTRQSEAYNFVCTGIGSQEVE